MAYKFDKEKRMPTSTYNSRVLLNALKSWRDRFAIDELAADPVSFVREMEITGIPFIFWATNFACAAPEIPDR